MFKISLPISTKKIAGILSGIAYIDQYNTESKNWQHWFISSINMDYLSIYVDLFLSLEIYTFPHINLVHIFLNLYFFSFFGAKVNSVMCFF